MLPTFLTQIMKRVKQQQMSTGIRGCFHPVGSINLSPNVKDNVKVKVSLSVESVMVRLIALTYSNLLSASTLENTVCCK